MAAQTKRRRRSAPTECGVMIGQAAEFYATSINLHTVYLSTVPGDPFAARFDREPRYRANCDLHSLHNLMQDIFQSRFI